VSLLRAIAAATAAELCAAGAALAVVGLFGGINGWCDVAAQFAPVWLAISAVGALLAWFGLKGIGGRIGVIALALIGLASSAALIAPELVRRIPAWRGAPPPRPLTLVTFNVWNDNIAPGATVDTILKEGADVIAIQEKYGLDGAPIARLRAAFPYSAYCAPGCGVEMLSRRPWTSKGIQADPDSAPDEAIWGVTTAPDGAPVEIATTHLSWPLPPGEQQRRRAALVEAVKQLQRPDLVLTGDLNLAPWSWALRGLDAALRPLVRRDRALFTWPANIDRPAPFAVLPIDHVYAGPAWQTVEARRLSRSGSDHYGLRVVLARATPAG